MIQSLPYIAFRPHSIYLPKILHIHSTYIPYTLHSPASSHFHILQMFQRICTRAQAQARKRQDLKENFNGQTPYKAARFLLPLFGPFSGYLSTSALCSQYSSKWAWSPVHNLTKGFCNVLFWLGTVQFSTVLLYWPMTSYILFSSRVQCTFQKYVQYIYNCSSYWYCFWPQFWFDLANDHLDKICDPLKKCSVVKKIFKNISSLQNSRRSSISCFMLGLEGAWCPRLTAGALLPPAAVHPWLKLP